MAKFKLDTKQLKQFFLERGEVIALGAAGLLVVFFFVYMLVAMVSSRSSAKEIDDVNKKLKGDIAGATPGAEEKSTKGAALPWSHPVKSGPFASANWYDASGVASNKREKPVLLALDGTQRGYLAGGVYTYEVAETKVAQVMDFSRQHQHPLQCTMEKE